jgi:D-proline reductase (dithiol) PrdB
MPRLETLSTMARQGLVTFPCLEYATAPWTPLRRPLAHSTLALVTTAGLHVRGDTPFITDRKGGDASFRVLPIHTPAGEILQSHVSIGFDHTAFYRDINVTFPA